MAHNAVLVVAPVAPCPYTQDPLLRSHHRLVAVLFVYESVGQDIYISLSLFLSKMIKFTLTKATDNNSSSM